MWKTTKMVKSILRVVKYAVYESLILLISYECKCGLFSNFWIHSYFSNCFRRSIFDRANRKFGDHISSIILSSQHAHISHFTAHIIFEIYCLTYLNLRLQTVCSQKCTLELVCRSSRPFP